MKKMYFRSLLFDSRLLAFLFGKRRRNRIISKRAQSHINTKIEKALETWIAGKGYRDSESSVEEIASRIGVGSGQLNYYCKQRFGCTFSALRTRIRIDEAKHLMIDCPEMSIAAIREEIGMKDKSNFRKYFEQATGRTPSAWRDEHLNR